MVKETISSLLDNINTRTTSPLSGTVLISWSLWNWKNIYIVLGNDDSLNLMQRIQLIEERVDLYINLIYPLVSTIFLIVLYPYVAGIALKIKIKYMDWYKKLNNERLLTRTEAENLQKRILYKENNLSELLSKKEEEIDDVKKDLEMRDNEIQKLTIELKESRFQEEKIETVQIENEKYKNKIKELTQNVVKKTTDYKGVNITKINFDSKEVDLLKRFIKHKKHGEIIKKIFQNIQAKPKGVMAVKSNLDIPEIALNFLIREDILAIENEKSEFSFNGADEIIVLTEQGKSLNKLYHKLNT